LVVWEPRRGLNGAVEAGVDHLATQGVVQVTVAHADLPLATGLSLVGESPGITLVPDRFGNGTNVIAVPAEAGFRFSYGPGSFARHRTEAERLGLPLRILDRPDLAYDVDEPADVVTLASPGPARR
jgi:2-phospho-L-lactate guanylyltransferase